MFDGEGQQVTLPQNKPWDYEQVKKFGSHAGQPATGHGVK
jgi:hypothetical protein